MPKKSKNARGNKFRTIVALFSIVLAAFVFIVVAQLRSSQELRSSASSVTKNGGPSLTTEQISKLSASCRQLYSRVKTSFGSKCGESQYNSAADINKDKQISLTDFSMLTSIASEETKCSEALKKTQDICLGKLPQPAATTSPRVRDPRTGPVLK